MVKFTVVGEILGFGRSDDGKSGFITILPVVVPGAPMVAPADPQSERPGALRVRYSPSTFKDAERALLSEGAKVQIEGFCGVFLKDKAPQLDGYGRPMPSRGQSRPYTNYYHELSKISKAAA